VDVKTGASSPPRPGLGAVPTSLSPIKLRLVFTGWGILVAIFAVFGTPRLQASLGIAKTMYANLAAFAIMVWRHARSNIVIINPDTQRGPLVWRTQASWKTRPRARRWPERTVLTPCRTGPADQPRALRTGRSLVVKIRPWP
jgi:hypothetical protein